MTHHPRFAGHVDIWRDRNHNTRIEGGDVQQYLDEAGYGIGTTHDALNDYLKTFNTRDLVTKLYAGVRRNEFDFENDSLHDLAGRDAANPFLLDPGAEVENITPDTMERLLFDDIPFLEIAQQEHDFFANTLRENGVETLYIDDLAVEALDTDEKVREAFVII
ncbi:hypothetical protein H7R52_02645 [Weissella confusa]|uniref:Arginine deiminase n=1 Tax=Weissella confusa TaxID=1583 RepID=A0A923NEI6_WEICO|nr:hypothetical protein [Weissella confusa]